LSDDFLTASNRLQAKLKGIEARLDGIGVPHLTDEDRSLARQFGMSDTEWLAQKMKAQGDHTARQALALDRKGETRKAAYEIRDKYFPHITDEQLEDELRREGL
jgi:hypothetical protein